MITDRLTGAESALAIKAPVLVASTGNITLYGTTQVIDGITPSTGDRVLAKDQTNSTDNGIYIVNASTWRRSPDFDGKRDVTRGTLVYVTTGAAQGGSVFIVTSSGDNVPGNDAIAFGQSAAMSVSSDVTVSSFMATVLDDSSATQARDTLGLTIGTSGDVIVKANTANTWNAAQSMVGAPFNEAKGSDIVSSSLPDLDAASGNFVDITGANTIYGFTLSPGRERVVRFASSAVLVHSTDSLVLPGAANIGTQAGDIAFVRGYSSGIVVVAPYVRANGGTGEEATRTQVTAAATTGAFLSPANAQYHPGVCKAWARFSGTSTAITPAASYNIASITYLAAGLYQIFFTTPFASANYSGAVNVSITSTSTASFGSYTPLREFTSSSVKLYTTDSGGTLTAHPVISVQFWGEQSSS